MRIYTIDEGEPVEIEAYQGCSILLTQGEDEIVVSLENVDLLADTLRKVRTDIEKDPDGGMPGMPPELK